MTTTEHLERIKTKCQELLAIAEKRPDGEWAAFHNGRTDMHGVIALSLNQDVVHCAIGCQSNPQIRGRLHSLLRRTSRGRVACDTGND